MASVTQSGKRRASGGASQMPTTTEVRQGKISHFTTPKEKSPLMNESTTLDFLTRPGLIARKTLLVTHIKSLLFRELWSASCCWKAVLQKPWDHSANACATSHSALWHMMASIFMGVLTNTASIVGTLVFSVT